MRILQTLAKILGNSSYVYRNGSLKRYSFVLVY
jgi:hypothetical protein